MTLRCSIFALCAVAGLSVLGCNSEPPEDAPPQRMKVEFKGQIDSKFAGNWTASDGSGLNLKKDGGADIVAISNGPSGKSSKTISGQWLVSGSDLLLEYMQGASKVVIKNAATLSGNSLTLIQAGNKHKTVYQRTS